MRGTKKAKDYRASERSATCVSESQRNLTLERCPIISDRKAIDREDAPLVAQCTASDRQTKRQTDTWVYEADCKKQDASKKQDDQEESKSINVMPPSLLITVHC